MAHPYVVLADRVRGFDTLDDARQFALANYPAVICERRTLPSGASELHEVERHDWLYDSERDEWRVMLG